MQLTSSIIGYLRGQGVSYSLENAVLGLGLALGSVATLTLTLKQCS